MVVLKLYFVAALLERRSGNVQVNSFTCKHLRCRCAPMGSTGDFIFSNMLMFDEAMKAKARAACPAACKICVEKFFYPLGFTFRGPR